MPKAKDTKDGVKATSLAKIAAELGVPVESLTKQNKALLDKYLVEHPG